MQTFKIRSERFNQNSDTIDCISIASDGRGWVVLQSDGKIETYRQQPPAEVINSAHKIVMNSRIPLTKDELQRAGQEKATRLEIQMSYEDDPVKIKAMSDQAKKDNELVKKTHEYLKQHYQFFVPDSKGNNTNSNLKSQAYQLIDVTAQKNDRIAATFKYLDYMQLIRDLYNEDEETLNELGYSLNFNPAKVSKDDLFLQIESKIKNDTDTFEKIFKNENKEYIILIRKSLMMPLESNPPVTKVGQYYNVNGNGVGSTIEEVVAYLQSNPNQFEGVKNAVKYRAGAEPQTAPAKTKNKLEEEILAGIKDSETRDAYVNGELTRLKGDLPKMRDFKKALKKVCAELNIEASKYLET